MGRDAGRAFTYLTPAVRDYQYFYLGVADTLTQVTFHVRACHDALILFKSAVSHASHIYTYVAFVATLTLTKLYEQCRKNSLTKILQC